MDKPGNDILTEVDEKLYHTYSECNYSRCFIMVYGDENSIVDGKVFCKRHYRMTLELKEVMSGRP